jgi:hypothetical protein
VPLPSQAVVDPHRLRVVGISAGRAFTLDAPGSVFP